MPFLEEMANRLVDAGVGVLATGEAPPAGSIFQGSAARLPEGDGPFLTLIAYGGSAPTRIHNKASAKTLRPSANVAVHCADMVAGLVMLQAAFDALDGIYNTVLSGAFYQSVVARQDLVDLGLDGASRLVYGFNIEAQREADNSSIPSLPPNVPVIPAALEPAVYELIELLGGDRNGFMQPANASNFPPGATLDKLVSGSWPIVLDGTKLYAGNYYFECSARAAAVGAFVAVALFDLGTDAFIPGSQVVFPADDTVGTRQRSGVITLPSVDTLIGAKLTTNNILIGGAAWGCRIIRFG